MYNLSDFSIEKRIKNDLFTKIELTGHRHGIKIIKTAEAIEIEIEPYGKESSPKVKILRNMAQWKFDGCVAFIENTDDFISAMQKTKEIANIFLKEENIDYFLNN